MSNKIDNLNTENTRYPGPIAAAALGMKLCTFYMRAKTRGLTKRCAHGYTLEEIEIIRQPIPSRTDAFAQQQIRHIRDQLGIKLAEDFEEEDNEY